MFTKRLAAGLAAMATLAAGPAFRDVTASTPHADDIRWAASAGITTGWAESDGTRTFRGMDSVKRQDMAAFMRRLSRLASRGTDVVPKQFRDVTASTPHADDIRWLGGSGVSTGYPDGTYRGMVSVYRQDMAAFLHRLDQLKPDAAASPVQQVVTTSMDVDGTSTFVVRKDGSLWAWGYNGYGQLGVGDTNNRLSPAKVMDNVSTINSDGSSLFVVRKDGSLWAWGRNGLGQLGVGDKNDRLTPAKVMDNVSTINFSLGSFFAVRKDGSLWAWGGNGSGQLGVGDTNNRPSPVKVM